MNPIALITTPFRFGSPADEVIAGVDLRGRRAIVTGASSGIGIETARVLASAGAEVTLAVRNWKQLVRSPKPSLPRSRMPKFMWAISNSATSARCKRLQLDGMAPCTSS